jgi:hypothetical protein
MRQCSSDTSNPLSASVTRDMSPSLLPNLLLLDDGLSLSLGGGILLVATDGAKEDSCESRHVGAEDLA